MKIKDAFDQLNKLREENSPYTISYEVSRGTKTTPGAHIICNRTTIGQPTTTRNAIVNALFSSKIFSINNVEERQANAYYQTIQRKDGTPIKINKDYDELNDSVLSQVKEMINKLFPPKSEHHQFLEAQAALLNIEQMHCFVKANQFVFLNSDTLNDLAPSLIFATNTYKIHHDLHAFLKSLSIKFEGFSDGVDDGHPRRFRTRINQDLTLEQSLQLQQYVTTRHAVKGAETKVSRGFFGKSRVLAEAKPAILDNTESHTAGISPHHS